MKKVSGNQIKLFMMFLTVLYYAGPLLPGNLAVLFDLLGSSVIAWFSYAAAEGVLYTRNWKRYLLRLYCLAGSIFAGNSVINTGLAGSGAVIYSNPVLTLALGVSLLLIISAVRPAGALRKTGKALAVAALSAAGFFCESGFIVIPVMLISFLLKENPGRRDAAFVVLSIVLLLMSFDLGNLSIGGLIKNPAFLFILFVPFVHMYSGQRGSHAAFVKYFFYFFYPLQLWGLHIIQLAVAVM